VPLSADFSCLVDEGPARAASVLQSALGSAAFREVLRSELQAGRHAVGHGLIASMRVAEVVTTNVDGLYELACETAFSPQRLSVLPWHRMPGRPPWILKLHGDLEAGDLVFTDEDYQRFPKDRRVLGAVVQALLVTRNLVFVGYSMRDHDFLELANEVAEALRRSGASHRTIGTVLSLVPHRDEKPGSPKDVRVIEIGDGSSGVSAEDARRMELFLDRMAWSAARDESSWVLDPRYEALLSEHDAEVVKALSKLPPLRGGRWQWLQTLLGEHGQPYASDETSG